MRKGNIEFRWSKINKKHELIKWREQAPDTCFTVAFFIKSKEGYYMETVGNRFFLDHDAWIVGKHALSFLNAVFEGA